MRDVLGGAGHEGQPGEGGDRAADDHRERLPARRRMAAVPSCTAPETMAQTPKTASVDPSAVAAATASPTDAARLISEARSAASAFAFREPRFTSDTSGRAAAAASTCAVRRVALPALA
jgi:hypothetical protein